MENKKSTKRALYSSVLSLVLCMAMLIGTTFAWFTDNVTSTGNIIKSGKLDAELNYTSEFTDIAADNWTDASTGAIFDYELWEPGYVDVKYVQVANVGNLAFKYLLNIIPETAVAAGDYNLADVIDVYITKNPTAELTRDALGTKVGTLASLMQDPDGAARGILLPAEGTGSSNVELAAEDAAIAEKGAVTVGIALKMQETAGNEYQELTVGNTFKVELLATQYTWENDSFDNKYDGELTPVGEGDVLREEDGIQYIYTPEGEKILYLVTDKYTSDIVNVPVGVTSIGRYSFYYNGNIKKVVLSSTVTTLDQRAFRGTSASEIVLNEGLESIGYQAFRDASNLKTITFSSTVKNIGEAAFQLSGLASVTIPATVENIEKGAFRDCPNLQTIVIEGNSTVADYVARNCSTLETVILHGDNVTFTGTSQAFCNANTGKSDKITIFVENDTVAAAVKKANGSCSGYSVVMKENLIEIASAEELFNFAKQVNAGNNMSGKVVRLTGNIDLENTVWTPIGQTRATQFLGTFDGANYTISNLKIDSSAQTGKHYSSGLFGWAQGKIKNVNVKGAEVIGHHNVGVIAGALERCQITNCHVYNATITCTMANDDANGDKAGGICGILTADADRVINCSVSNSTISAGRDAGQVVGAATAGKDVNVIDCSATNVTVTANGTSTGANINNEIIGRK